jgi:uncharacterized protein YutE (UPF0331/DUF86 family)
VVDRRRVRRLLQRIADDLAFLAERRDLDRSAIGADAERMAAIKYVFVTAIEGCIDVAQHLCASEGWGPPASNAGAVRELSAHQVLGTDLGEAVASAVGFRNVLVHGYVDVDDQRVLAFLDRVGELASFVDAVSAWTAAASDDD